LSGLTNLPYLNLYNTQISDISPLTALIELTYLDIDNNPISYESMLLSQYWALPWSASTYTAIAPCYPDPERNAMDVAPDAGLSWQANYGFSPTVLYEVYLGASSDVLTLLGEGTLMEDTIYNFATNLDPFTQYWWKVKAIDDTTAVWSGLWSFTTGSATEFAGGSGTEADPYLVATAANLNNVRNYPGAHFLQMADIDLGVAPWNEGEGWVPIGNASAAFSGTYNGNSFAITGLYQNRPTEDYQGLFGFTFYGLITGVSMQFANISGGNWCGAVIGRANSTTITNCISSGVVNGTGGSIGGLIGRMDSATLNQSNSSVYVNGDG